MAVTKKQLIGAGNELQKVLNVGDPDKFDPKASYDDIKAWVVEARDILDVGDEISAATQKVVDALAPEEPTEEKTQSEEPTEQTETPEEAEQESPVDSPEDEGEAPEEDDAEPPEQESPPEAEAKAEEVKPKKKAPAKEKKSKTKQKKESRVKRAAVMASIIRKSAKKPMTREQMIEQMKESYSGSEAEAKCHTTRFVDLLLKLELLKIGEGDTLSYTIE